jgi:hypothetical protein
MTRKDALTALRELSADLRTAALDEVLAAADLQTRTDRKYLVPPRLFEALVDGIRDNYRVLNIAGLRVFRYESVYYDTPDLASYLGAARGRRHRFKVRTRTYLDSGQSVLEVKTTGGRGETLKVRIPYPMAHRFRIDAAGTAFVDDVLDLAGGAQALTPVLTTTYSRTTLVDLHHGARVTCDADLAMTDRAGGTVTMRDHVLLETKTASTAGPPDRLLWRLGVRPSCISKYGVGYAALNPSLPANRWRRTLDRFFGAGDGWS